MSVKAWIWTVIGSIVSGVVVLRIPTDWSPLQALQDAVSVTYSCITAWLTSVVTLSVLSLLFLTLLWGASMALVALLTKRVLKPSRNVRLTLTDKERRVLYIIYCANNSNTNANADQLNVHVQLPRVELIHILELLDRHLLIESHRNYYSGMTYSLSSYGREYAVHNFANTDPSQP